MGLENMMKLVSKSGERHGIIKRVANSVPDDGFKRFAEKDRPAMEKLKKEQSRIVKARYINHKGPNERLDTPYCNWSGDPIDSWHCIPGEEYEVPMGLVEQVNDPSKRVPQRSGLIDVNNVPLPKDGPPVKVHEFVPSSF